MTFKLVMLTFSLLAIAEGFFIVLFPKVTMNLVKQMTRNAKSLRKVALTEIFLALIIFLIALYLI
jgi:uncharacterized protein YjeT (DUF2065 family)